MYDLFSAETVLVLQSFAESHIYKSIKPDQPLTFIV